MIYIMFGMKGLCRDFLVCRDWIVAEELINCLFLQRTFLSNFPQSLSASEHTVTTHITRYLSLATSPPLPGARTVLCQHPQLTDCRACVLLRACARALRCLWCLETGSWCYVTGNGTGCTPAPASHLPCVPVSRPRGPRAGHHASRPQSTLDSVVTIHLNILLHANNSRTARNLIKEE